MSYKVYELSKFSEFYGNNLYRTSAFLDQVLFINFLSNFYSFLAKGLAYCFSRKK